MSHEDYQRYLASPQWARRRQAVVKRAGGTCERCGGDKIRAVHHLTYARVGYEELDDLQGVCDACHEYLGGRTDADPAGPRKIGFAVR